MATLYLFILQIAQTKIYTRYSNIEGLIKRPLFEYRYPKNFHCNLILVTQYANEESIS